MEKRIVLGLGILINVYDIRQVKRVSSFEFGCVEDALTVLGTIHSVGSDTIVLHNGSKVIKEDIEHDMC